MSGWTRHVAVLLALLGLGIGCGPVEPGGSGGAVSSSVTSSGAAVKRIALGSGAEPDARPTARAPANFMVPLVQAGLTVVGDQRARRPMLAEAVPSLDNGLWKLLPDGRMETTWRLRESARWHDGTPLTAED